jgi:hypothetical protein
MNVNDMAIAADGVLVLLARQGNNDAVAELERRHAGDDGFVNVLAVARNE